MEEATSVVIPLIKQKLGAMLKETIKRMVHNNLLIPFGASAYLWNDLPDMVPTHFNI